jgi:hypothetical protein
MNSAIRPVEATMCTVHPLTRQALAADSHRYQGTRGTSAAAGGLGYRPGFMDRETGVVYPSRFADGRPAPLHLIDGLPDHLVAAYDGRGRVAAVKPSVVAGFLRDGRFYTREQVRSAAPVAGEGALRHRA